MILKKLKISTIALILAMIWITLMTGIFFYLFFELMKYMDTIKMLLFWIEQSIPINPPLLSIL